MFISVSSLHISEQIPFRYSSADSRDSDQFISVNEKGIKVGIKDVIYVVMLSSSPR